MILVKEHRVAEASDPYRFIRGADVPIFKAMIKSAENYIKIKGINADKLKAFPTSYFEQWGLYSASIKAWDEALKNLGLGEFTLS